MSIDEHLDLKIAEIISKQRADEFLSMQQVEKEFGCSRSWIYRQHANGHLPIYKLGGKTRVKRSELAKLAVAI